MSKYIDLEEQIVDDSHAHRQSIFSNDARVVLRWLDDHPELTGRTIAAERYRQVHRMDGGYVRGYEDALAELGGVVEPEPTNKEQLEALLEGGDINAQWGLRGGGVMFARELAHALDKAGVRAAGGE